jgi:hypothetical protein
MDLAAVLAGAITLPAEGKGTWRSDVTVVGEAEGWVFFDSAWWPGWTVTVDGVETPVYEAFGGRLVPVPAGEHVVVSELSLTEVKLGALAGLAAVVSAGLWVAWPRIRRRRAGTQPASTSR